jgi:twitching motility protein PilT
VELKALLALLVQHGGSDMILKTGSFPAARVNRRIRYLSDEKVSARFSREVLAELREHLSIPDSEHAHEFDLAMSVEAVGRFRVNAFRQCGNPAFVFRHVKSEVPDFRKLCLPVDQLKSLSTLSRGLVLVTGIAGSGKSTTLAAMVEEINRSMNRHVVTIEDPIEYLFEDKLSVISQREIGLDCEDFRTALKHCVRQSPDVIMIGEMRDRDTVEAAVNAAETGHLVLSTLHTVNAVQTVERIITFFPPHQHELIRLQLSMNLAGVVSQRLIRTKSEGGVVPACEILLSTPTVRELLQQGKTRQLEKALAEGAYYGTMTFNQSLIRLYETGNIDLEEALAASDNPDELKLLIRGVSSGSGTAAAAVAAREGGSPQRNKGPSRF